MKLVLIFSIIVLHFSPMYAQDKLLEILKEELDREMSEFGSTETPPYYMEYRVSDYSNYAISASFGSLVGSNFYKSRVFTADMRIGDYKFDNTHMPDAHSFGYESYSGAKSTVLPVEDDELAIKQMIWLTTDQLYKTVQNQYYTVINTEEIRKREALPDFSKEVSSKYYQEPLQEKDRQIDIEQWEGKLKMLTAKFKNNPYIINGTANFSVVFERRYFVSTEGSEIVQNFTLADIHITGSVLCDDGNLLPLYLSFNSFGPEGFPSIEIMEKKTEDLIQKLEMLRLSSVAEPYTGPAIFSPRVAGVFFHEIFGHRIEGHRLRSDMDGQTFKSQLGNKVLPKFLSVISDPTIKKFEDQDLVGHYTYDDQGIASRKVTLVENGLLKSFLMSRSPLNNIDQSNGHGRASAGNSPVSRQSNLFIKSDKVVSEMVLRKMLVKECKKQKKDYGYYFKEVTGGFTTTDRYMPNAFNIMPTEVYKIYVDGRPDELVRGVDLIGTPLAMFSEIEAAGDAIDVFNGHCGAESGYVPVAAIAPSLLVNKIETQKKIESLIKLPILRSPEFDFNLNGTKPEP